MTTRQHPRDPAPAMTTTALSSSSAAAAQNSAPHTVRRNLFSARASRRPVRSESTASSTAATVIDHPLDSAENEASPSSSEILVRNPNGDYAIDIPSARLLMDDADGMDGAGEQQGDDFEDEDHLLELLKTRTRKSNEQELLDAVRISLKRKVEALVDDEWMFQGGK